MLAIGVLEVQKKSTRHQSDAKSFLHFRRSCSKNQAELDLTRIGTVDTKK
jgi:hypothetical protein